MQHEKRFGFGECYSLDDVCTGLSKQESLDEVCLEIGDVTLVWDDGKQVKAHKELEEVLEVVRV